MGLLEGKVILVTGAGGGIGRCHALACAREGAHLVVNDLGGTRDGAGSGSAMADLVVAEIEALGGQAVANYDSVTDFEGCERMVASAIERWGKLDAIVNNAGILRDKTFAKMSEAEWDIVVAVHLTGTRNVTRAALNALKAGGGSIINTTSYSGMIGNFGQSNYAAAKAGIYGFTRVMSMELRKYKVTANCLAPVAKTRMTEDIDMVGDELHPEQISPVVVFLASDLARGLTGKVFGVQGQRIHMYEVQTNDGVEKEGTEFWTAQEIADRIDDITNFEVDAPAVAAGEGVDPVTLAFSFFPAGYDATKAPGWKCVIHWKIKGGTSQTLTVDGETATAEVGLTGSPTCTVNIDQDTMLGLLRREIDGQKAFMSGKASADNFGDLMKMGMAFDFNKVKAAAEAAGATSQAAPSQGDGGEPLENKVFSYFPKGFKEGVAKGWDANIQWKVKGGTSQTIIVEGGTKARVVHALEGSPTCTVKLSKDTLVGMFSGQINPQKAFMSGKAAADNMGDLMKLGMAFDFKAIGAAFKADNPDVGAAPAAAPADDGKPFEMPIGKRYDGGYWQVKADEFTAYAAATDDANAAYAGDDAIAPPMYHTKPFIKLMMKLATDPALKLDLLRLVHAEHDVKFHRPLRHGDVLQLRGRLQSHEIKSSGTLTNFEILGFVDGQLAIDGTTAYFIRGTKKPGEKKAPKPQPEPLPEPTLSLQQSISEDQAIRYSAASGDDNPIHTDEATAKAAGLPRTILHGLCTMAFAQRDLINQIADGDPTRLKRLGVRWSRPVLPGSTLTLKAWDKGDGNWEFMQENDEGKPVVVNGRATVG